MKLWQHTAYLKPFILSTLILTAVFAATPATSAEKASGAVIAAVSTATIMPEEPNHFVYLTTGSIPPTLLVAPPKPKSKIWRADLAKIIQVQKYVASSEISQAQAEQKVRPELVTTVLGQNFTREKLPLTFILLDNVVADSESITKEAKGYWHIPRPYIADHRVMLQVAPLAATNFAYPSGHTSTSLVLAKLLSDLVPSAQPALLKIAEQVAARRIVAGVHFHHDISAGQQLGEAVYLQLKAQPAFQVAFVAAQNELAAAGYHQAMHGCAVKPVGKKNWKHFKSRITE